MTPDQTAREKLEEFARTAGISLENAKLRRTSSRFCLGVEHGDYNGTELFGVGTDRFIWLAYRPNGTDKVRMFSGNFPGDGVVEFVLGAAPEPGSHPDSWARFPFGAAWVLQREGMAVTKGFDAVLYGNIPGGGMSRSASLSINLLLTLAEVNGIEFEGGMQVVDLAQALENNYIGSPCGKLDQIMIYFAREGMGTHYNPADRSISHVPLGEGAEDFRIVSLDTGTVRPGLEKSTYKIRHDECRQLVALAGEVFEITSLAEVRTGEKLKAIFGRFQQSHPHLCARLEYIHHAQKRFYQMLDAWKAGDVEEVGRVFRADGIGLRDQYQISGPELESMCDIARTVPGVLGERMLGGGDKGASGALVRPESVDALRKAVETGYPRSHPAFAENFAIHSCKFVDGVADLPGW